MAGIILCPVHRHPVVSSTRTQIGYSPLTFVVILPFERDRQFFTKRMSISGSNVDELRKIPERIHLLPICCHLLVQLSVHTESIPIYFRAEIIIIQCTLMYFFQFPHKIGCIFLSIFIPSDHPKVSCICMSAKRQEIGGARNAQRTKQINLKVGQVLATPHLILHVMRADMPERKRRNRCIKRTVVLQPISQIFGYHKRVFTIQ